MILGIIIGILIAVCAFLGAFAVELRLQKRDSSIFEQIQSKISIMSDAPVKFPKGYVIEPKSDEIDAFEKMLKEDDKRGKDTELKDVLS